MKRITLVALSIAVIAAFGCHKNDDSTPIKEDNEPVKGNITSQKIPVWSRKIPAWHKNFWRIRHHAKTL